MAKKYNFRLNKFAVQLPLLFFVSGLAVILIFCSVIYFAVSNVLLEETVAHTKNMLKMGSVNISTYIDRLWSESNILANDPDLQEYLSIENSAKKTQLEQKINVMIENDPFIKSIVAVSKDGRILSNEKNLDMSISEDMMQEKWYIDALHADMPILTSARMQSFSKDKDNWVISISNEVTDKSGENLGVLLVDMKYSVIEQLLQSIDLGKAGYVFLLNDKNELVYHKKTSFFQDNNKQIKLVSLMKQGSGYDSENNLLTAKTRIDNAGWIMLAVVHLDNLLILRRHLFEAVLFTGGLLLLLMLAIGTFFTKRLTNPIIKMEKNMLQIEKLAEIEMESNSFYEMRLFTENYNRMINRVRRLLEELSYNEESLRRLEFQTLTDQINPHFLYSITHVS